MNKLYNTAIFLFLCLPWNCLLAQVSSGQPITEKVVKKSHWKGFQRFDFSHHGKEARLIVPARPLPGNPWVWRARFPDWHTEADSILVAEGYHLAHINTSNLYGGPEAMDIWDSFYAFLLAEYKLRQKVALMGVSREGLFIYNWAKKNPGKVTCIYAEAPVCDFKSWPGGLGKGRGSSKDWVLLKKAYRFAEESEALNYGSNPIDSLEILAENKIPLLHTIGLNDKIVPAEENTLPLINKYIRLGGTATVVPCTTGEQSLEGHHFAIETPGIVADFIKYHSRQYLPLSPAGYHLMRSGLQNARIKFERDKKGRVAFLGGSITYNPGWRDSLCSYLKARFPETEFEFVAAGIPSMGSTPAAFRLQRDVLSKGKTDLLFEEAAVNDAVNGRTKTEQIRALEGIVRHCRASNPEMDVVLMHFADPEKIAEYNSGVEPKVIANHERVARHYDIPSLNLAKEVTDRINNGEFTWEDDFKNLHPSPFGQGIYAHSMIHFLSAAFSGHLDADDKMAVHPLPQKMDTHAYDNGQLISLNMINLPKGWNVDGLTLTSSFMRWSIDLPKGWHIEKAWHPNDGKATRHNYVNVPMLIGDTPGAVLKFKFEGSAIGIAVAAGPDAGVIEYRIDKKEWKKRNLYTRWSAHLHLPWYHVLSGELTKGQHLLEIRMAKPADNKAKACRIRYFFTNGQD